MASSYPSGLDSFSTITADKLLSDEVGGRTHRGMHNDMGDVIEAMQAELGLNPSGQAATVAARLDNQSVFNVRDYGAVGNGTTDDSAAIRAALSAGAGAVVYFPEGTYKVSKDGANSYCLSVPAGTTIAGPGTVKLAASSDEWVQVFHVGAVDGVTFDGITIDGNKGNNTTHEHRHGIMVTDVTGFAARNCRIVDCTGDGIMLDTSTQCQITGNHITGCERNAVTLYADVISTSTSFVRIVDNYLECASQPVDSEPENSATTDDIHVIGNTFVRVIDERNIGNAIVIALVKILTEHVLS